jgi:hypothetical protein
MPFSKADALRVACVFDRITRLTRFDFYNVFA